ncbi:site-specific integrase [Amycolatopsis anabasis]|uniref:site-specific integrase n=1 Tax=Amycolatopsis anabasis TaxID=1840409 RepID=UPI001C550F11|nr:site-specific integrase [Amycolatopsis anabasis]
MISTAWTVHYLPGELPRPAAPLPFAVDLPRDWDGWLVECGVPPRTPFLLSPQCEYDVELNEFFRSPGMLDAAWNTQAGYARDLCAFLTFLWTARERTTWREATESDHLAYAHWRRRDPDGPRIDHATWDREVAAQNRFFAWQVTIGMLRANPVPQRERRASPTEAGCRARRAVAGVTPATYSHGADREKIECLPPASYRLWRDVGMRGFTPQGLPSPRFRGRWSARNATFCDLMVRTGMRLAEQSALTVFEVPLACELGGYQRFWLPPAIAKGGSSRWIYAPASVVADLVAYAEIDRTAVIAQARDRGDYRRWRRPLVVEDPARPVARTVRGHRIKVSQLDVDQRLRLLVDGPDGLAPGVFWVSEYGTPITRSTWKDLFRTANLRCRAQGVPLWVHAHLLRHAYAVVTLEQLQRGHIAALATMDGRQRDHYVRVFGDPLDWLRRRLGHASVVTTQVYLHALAELEMETRMALVPDSWEDPRPLVSDAASEDVTAPIGPAA